MGQGGYITLANETDRQWTRTHQHSYQMDWDFPERIAAGSQQRVYVEWHEGPFTTESDDAGEARYLLDGTEIGFEVQARAKNGYLLQVVPINLPGNVIELGWKHDGAVRFALRGTPGTLSIATNDTWSDVPLTDWMSRLNGALKLSELTLPGTHDTCARDCHKISETQTLTVRGQLDAGVRFLDVRCRHVGDAFAIHHGREFLNQWFDEVRDACYAFLAEHPRETIVMLVKHEYDDADNTRSYQSTFDSYIAATRQNWYLDSRIPSLDEVRGKIVLLRRFPGDTTAIGIDAQGDRASTWVDDGTFVLSRNGVTLRVQDNYGVPTMFDVPGKWNRVRQHLDDALGGGPADWYLNYASGGSAFAYPESVAKGTPGCTGINDRLQHHLEGSSRGRYGTLLLDFAEYPAALIRTIVSLNPITS